MRSLNLMKCLLVLMVLGLLVGCQRVTVDPGEEHVIVDKPYFFGEGGVRSETLKTGSAFLPLSAETIVIRVVPEIAEVSFNDFSSADNILLDFSTTIQYRILNPVELVTTFGPAWFRNNIQNQYSAIVRDVVKRYSMSDMMSNVAVAAEVDAKVTEQIQALIQEKKIPVEILNITLGRAVPDGKVLEQMNKTAEQQQRVKTLFAAVEAEEQRKQEQEAKAAADNAYRVALGLTSQQYLEREIAEMYASACQKAANCIVTPGNTSVLVSGASAGK